MRCEKRSEPGTLTVLTMCLPALSLLLGAHARPREDPLRTRLQD